MIYICALICQSILLGKIIRFRNTSHFSLFFNCCIVNILYLAIMMVYYEFHYQSLFIYVYKYVYLTYILLATMLLVLMLQLNKIKNKWINAVYLFPIITFFVAITNSKTGLLFKNYYINTNGKIEFSDGDFLHFNIKILFIIFLTSMFLMYRYIKKFKKINPTVFVIICTLFTIYSIVRHTTYYLQDTVDLSVLGSFMVLLTIYYFVYYKDSELSFLQLGFMDTLDTLDIEYGILNKNNEILAASPVIEAALGQNNFRQQFDSSKLMEQDRYIVINNKYYSKKTASTKKYNFVYLVDSTKFYKLTKKVEEREFLVKGISHDVKVPISIIKLNNQIKDAYSLTETEKEEFTKEIMIACDDIENMIKNLMEYMYIARDKKDTITNIKEVIQSLHTFKIRETDNLKLVIEENLNDCYVDISINDIKRVLYNILDNAFKYTDNGIIKVSYDLLEDEVIIKVKDTGIGIEKKDLANIYTIFYRTENSRDVSGLGLGLSIVKKILDNHGHKIEIKSAKGLGTEVLITLIKV